MLTTEDLDRARATYRCTRQVWFAASIADAHERLAVITVAAGLRRFAFLCYLAPQPRKRLSELLSSLGFRACVFSPRFDLDFKVSRVSEASANAYKAYKLRNERFFGLGVWPNSSQEPAARSITVTNLGPALAYPECCVRMDVQTKHCDHDLFLRALVNEVGDDPGHVSWGLRRRSAVEKASSFSSSEMEPAMGTHNGAFPVCLACSVRRVPKVRNQSNRDVECVL